MKTVCSYLPDEDATITLAKNLALCISFPLILTLSGDLGAGKTTFIRALLKALGVSGAIKSPTFSLVESYHCKNLPIHHFDLYRIHDEQELDYIGFRDYFTHESLCCIEWPEKAPHSLEAVDIQGMFRMNGEGRHLDLQAQTPKGERILSCLAGDS